MADTDNGGAGVGGESRQRTEGETHRMILVGVDGAGQVNDDNEPALISGSRFLTRARLRPELPGVPEQPSAGGGEGNEKVRENRLRRMGGLARAPT